MSFFSCLFIYYTGDVMSKEKFLSFARVHPELAKQVLKGNASWQQLYELYEIYGEKHSIWNQFMRSGETIDFSAFKDLFEMIRKVDFQHVQTGIQNIQKTIGFLQDIGVGNSNGNRR